MSFEVGPVLGADLHRVDDEHPIVGLDRDDLQRHAILVIAKEHKSSIRHGAVFRSRLGDDGLGGQNDVATSLPADTVLGRRPGMPDLHRAIMSDTTPGHQAAALLASSRPQESCPGARIVARTWPTRAIIALSKPRAGIDRRRALWLQLYRFPRSRLERRTRRRQCSVAVCGVPSCSQYSVLPARASDPVAIAGFEANNR